MKQVRIYYNFHKKLYSVQTKLNGQWRVTAHQSAAFLKNVTFRVSESGRQRVLKEKRKNVHAYICGTESGSFDYYKKLRQVNYNPYLFGYFFEKESGDPVYKAPSVLICGKKIIITH